MYSRCFRPPSPSLQFKIKISSNLSLRLRLRLFPAGRWSEGNEIDQLDHLNFEFKANEVGQEDREMQAFVQKELVATAFRCDPHN
mmetsp:Transcript_38235/g.75124  ORF Transcript_38235/g.75124 Transcript_38235/m.75124 type:complete len:85 (+) Transcript_38235:683-937(+)